MKAMIFAAGLGTRLKPFTDNAPKALAIVGDKTLLERNIRYLQQYGIFDVIVNVHHFADMIVALISKNNGFGSKITLSDERDGVLETGGGLKKAAWYFEGDVSYVVMNVDVLTNLDLGRLIAAHNPPGTIATLTVSKRQSSRQLIFDDNLTLSGWKNNATNEEKVSRLCSNPNPYAFSGIQVLSNAIWDNAPFKGKFSLIDLYLHTAKTRIIKGYDHTGDIFIDVGKPESITQAEQLFS
jgi:MurNAc alpha-1-phosphate uridylyltransferase